jgi:PIN domain nuclease of toxin-antitoxin system
MIDAVLDASAVLAYLRKEPGVEIVGSRIAGCVLTSVNAGEVVTRLITRGVDASAAVEAVELLPCLVVAVDGPLGLRAGALAAQTMKAGLSLGDRICLACAEREGVPALTADQGWRRVALPIAVEYIR